MSELDVASIEEYDKTIDFIKIYSSHKTNDLLLLFGYILFGAVAVTSLLETYKDPILFLRNLLFVIGFIGIATEYYFKYTTETTIETQHIISNKRFLFYNACMVLYGIISILYANSKYHMNVFYRIFVDKPTLFGLEIDALLVFISHSFLVSTAFIHQSDSSILLDIIYGIFIVSYLLSFYYNAITPIIKNQLLYYIITIGSLSLLMGYLFEFELQLQK